MDTCMYKHTSCMNILYVYEYTIYILYVYEYTIYILYVYEYTRMNILYVIHEVCVYIHVTLHV